MNIDPKLKEILEDLETAINRLTVYLSEREGQTDVAAPDTPVDPHPWLTAALRWEGKDEVDDNTELSQFLGFDPEETPWCAGFVSACLKQADRKALGLRARDYAKYGTEGTGDVGEIAVWRSHVGFVVNANEVIGGNVSNEVKRSPHPNSGKKDWFRHFIGFRKVGGTVS